MSIEIFEILTFSNLLISALGAVAGIIFGFLPGLSGTMAVAVMLPFTFSMTAIPSFSLLLGVYCGATFGGAITAILIRTPGTPSAVVTTLDGYPMAQQGRALEAMSGACLTSFFGGVISCLVLVLTAQSIARLALKFGPTEYFAVGLFGLSIVTTLSSKNIKKGIIAACFGIMLSTVGMDPVGGLVRYTWDLKPLIAGLQLVPVIIGIFAITEVLSKLDNSRHKAEQEILGLAGRFISVKTLWRNKFNIIRSSLIGTMIGIIPGTGGGTASWLSYATTMKFSKEPESFGKGQIDGLIASESANNGVTGGTLLPMLTLGVPGDSVAAVMLGALTLQGLSPGPMLFTEHGDVVTGIYTMLATGNLFMLIFGLLLVPLCVKILKVPEGSLMAGVLLLCLVGSFAMRSNPFDVMVAIIIGALGYFFVKAGFPIPPVIIGMVLGNLVESNFRRALILSSGSYSIFFTRPISLVFIIIAVVMFFWPIIIKMIKERKAKQTAVK